MQQLELLDIQGLVRSGYEDYGEAAYLLFAIDQPHTARGWLAGLLAAGWIGSAAETIGFRMPADPAARQSAFIAFTRWGLNNLGLPRSAFGTFVSEFQEGMVAPHRSRLLGDVGDSAPERWYWGNRCTEDILLIVYALNLDDLQDCINQIARIPGYPRLVHRLNARYMTREPFGFVDGLSQPQIEGMFRDRAPTGQRLIKAGEFLLGYRNEIDRLPASPSIAPEDDQDNLLARLDTSGRADFGRNGSYLVLRQLEQDVARFQDFVGADRGRAARMVGRWQSGVPLVRYESDPQNNFPKDDNSFGYYREDRHGFRCPIGAHIRRANPRDSLADGTGVTPERAREMADQHRILRRGRVYEENGETGLLFLCLNANIERQFEFIQNSWVMHPEFGGLHEETDPLLGNARPGEVRAMTIQNPWLNERVGGLRQFVTVKGGGYFFLPGLRAIQYLSQLGAGGGAQAGTGDGRSGGY